MLPLNKETKLIYVPVLYKVNTLAFKALMLPLGMTCLPVLK